MKISIPLTVAAIKRLKAGDLVYLSGTIYTARDRAHAKIAELLYIYKGKRLPFPLQGAVIYYCGPTPRKKNEIIGSCGPTTSSRMDRFTPQLYKYGLGATIGKGERSNDVIEAIKKYKGVYFITWGGCGAYLRKFVKKARIIAYPESGAEAIRELKVCDFPAVVAIDSCGRTIFINTD